MKRPWAITLIITGFVAVSAILLYFGFYNKKPASVPEKRQGVAIIMTGAAARIPQEAALLEELDKRGMLDDIVFISGVSSGALNAVLLNGIIEKKITWKEYRNILYNIKNKDIVVYDHVQFPFDTSPARALYTKIVEKKLGYKTIGDLPVTTSISVAYIKKLPLKKVAYRMSSRKINEESDTTLNLVDILMASTAFPIVFPPVRIPNVKTIPDVEYIDGGVGDDEIPFKALLQFEKQRGIGVEKVFIISRNGDDATKISEEFDALGIDDDGVFDELDLTFDTFLRRGLIKRLKAYAVEAPELVPLTYVWIPDFNDNFPMFDFGTMKQQYNVTTRWAKKNPPTPFAEYLLPYLLEDK